MSKETKSEILSWIFFIGASVICAVLINAFVIFNAYIPSGSMENTIMTKDRVMGLRLTYLFGNPERYDVAIFKFPDNEKEYYVKRVIGLPGEKVLIKEGKVYINDSETPLDEWYLKELPYEEDRGPYEIPEGCYFMLGDNRNISKDARFWINTYVKREKILAKAYFTMWPKPRMIK